MHDEKKQFNLLLLVVFLGLVGTSMAYPIFPPLFLHASTHSIIPSTWDNSLKSIFLGLALAAYPLGQFFGSPIFGGCSDAYGRKKMLIISLSGSAFGYFFTACALELNWLWVLLASRFLTGFMEANFSIARAMAADLTHISKYKSIGLLNGAASLGYVMGPLLGGFLSDSRIFPWFSFSFPFFAAMILTIITLLVAHKKLIAQESTNVSSALTLFQRFNLVQRFTLLFRHSKQLKYLLIISTIFTFSIDIFYEFGPVYLTGLWAFNPAGIALYNASLSITLAIGNGWLAHQLSLHFPATKSVFTAMLISALILALLALCPSHLFSFLLFSLIGLSIGVVSTKITTQISDATDKTIQGETLGSQWSLRMLGDASICMIGGFLIISSVRLPIAVSCLIALTAAVIYFNKRTLFIKK